MILDGRGIRVGIVRARFNETITEALAQGCRAALARHGVNEITELEVPGARELGVVCKQLTDTGRFDAIVAIGCVVRGETAHFEYVAGQASADLGSLAMSSGVPVIFAVLTTETWEQAQARSGGKFGNIGYDAGVVAIEMAMLMESIQKGNA